MSIGLSPIPVKWDNETRFAISHPCHEIDIPDGKLTSEILQKWFTQDGYSNANAMALKMYPPFGSIDFDLKNTDNKSVFDDWLLAVKSQNEDILSKIVIEKTRSGGYHAYIKYGKLSHKIPIARNPDGNEIISVYTGGLLSYCAPTPNYEIIHNDWSDLDFLTDSEFELLISTAAIYNEMTEWKSGDKTVALINYPVEFENTCMQFDSKCTDDMFEILLNSINLFRVTGNRQFDKKSFVPFLRSGSKAAYSGKVYFHSKRLLLFSASMVGYPTWHDSVSSGDETWSLSPAKIVYYKNAKNWNNTIDEINTICESAGIEITQPVPLSEQPLFNSDRIKFPYDIFPDEIIDYMYHLSINEEYFAAYSLGAISSAIGKTATLQAKDNYFITCNIYIGIVGSPGSDKSPAIKDAFKFIKEHDRGLKDGYKLQMDDYKAMLALYEKDKKNNTKPDEPIYKQVRIMDSTIEMIAKILSNNPLGCVLYADELSGFMARMNQYKTGDEVQKWLEMWSGEDILVQRMSREENYVESPFMSVVGGIQAGLLESLSSSENEHNGFYHRFLFSYPEMRDKNDWEVSGTIPGVVNNSIAHLYGDILAYRMTNKHTYYKLSPEAYKTYGAWYNHKNSKYNKATQDHVKGIIAKYQNYCLRFALMLQVLHDRLNRTGYISDTNMQRAIRLTEYFMGNMIKALRILKPDSPADKLQAPFDKIYAELPEMFTIKAAVPIAEKYMVKEGTLKQFITRYADKGKLFAKIKRGEYEKLY